MSHYGIYAPAAALRSINPDWLVKRVLSYNVSLHVSLWDVVAPVLPDKLISHPPTYREKDFDQDSKTARATHGAETSSI